MEIKDLQGKVIKVTDLPQSIIQVKEYLSYRYEQREKSLIDFETQRLNYWRDVYRQLIMLQYHSSDNPNKLLPEFITETDTGAWVCVCGDSEGFCTCDSEGNEMEPLIGSDWDALYACTGCGRIIHEDTLQVIGQKEA
jgi:hypothetical protein